MAETNGLNDYARSRSRRLGQKQMRPQYADIDFDKDNDHLERSAATSYQS